MITPTMFMVAIETFEMDEESYDWNDQVRPIKNVCMATTFRATQTYDSKGNPKDNDND